MKVWLNSNVCFEQNAKAGAMPDFIAFLRDCAASGTLLGSVCGLAIVPFVAWLGTRALAPTILRMRDEPAWQAPVAVVAAALPGAIFLSLAVIGLIGAASSGCLDYAWGRGLFALIIAAMVIAFARAIALAYRRQREVKRLIALSLEPEAWLEGVADSCNVRIRVLESQQPFCALAGTWKPVVLVSRGSLGRLDREQLVAALHHERAHAARGDLVLGAAISFFVDVLPLPAADLVGVYGSAREIAADEHALRRCDPDVLASAIVALASPRAVLATASFAEETKALKCRIDHVLRAVPGPVVSRRRRTIAVGALLVIVAVSFAPVALSAMNFYSCTANGMHV